MAGGTFTAQNKIRPGVYIRFNTANTSSITAGERGIVAICEPLTWGPVGVVNEVTPISDVTALTGHDITATQNRFLAEIFKGTNRTAAPNKVLLYRPAASSTAAASATIGDLTATANYAGSRGNDITIVVVANTDSTYTVETIIDGSVADTQTVTAIDELAANEWVTFSGTGSFTATTGTALTGGIDGTISASAYTTFLNTIEGYHFDILCYDGEDSTVLTAMQSFIKRIADEEGKYAQLVVAGVSNPDSRFVINVQNGVTLDDGTVLTPQQATWWVAGVEAGARYNESLTYATYPGATVATPSLTNSAIISAITAGGLVLQSDDGVVRIETDINSLVTYTETIGKVYRKNRVVRLCNQIANDVYAEFANNFIGIVNNNEIGRSRFKASIVGYLTGIQANQGIQNFTPDDVEVLAGEDIDAVVINIAIQPVDSVEKIYMTIEVA